MSTQLVIESTYIPPTTTQSQPRTAKGDRVQVHYTGTLTTGVKFDSSRDPGRSAFEFTLGQRQVITGWDRGLLGMVAGEKRKLTIPPDLAYGDAGFAPKIPPRATLVFEVELVAILPKSP